MKKMHRKVLINLIPISAGGGLQNALSFISSLTEFSEEDGREISYLIACRRGSKIHDYCEERKISFVTFSAGLIGRLYFELLGAWILVRSKKLDLVFTLFGPPPINIASVIRISGFAYSNIIQREVDFWGFLPAWKGFLKRSVDKVRYLAALRSDELILETDYLASRAAGGVFANKKISVVKMAPSLLVQEGLRHVSKGASEFIDILYLAGAHPNKRIHLLPLVFFHLVQIEPKFRLVTTLPEDSEYFKNIKGNFDGLGIGSSLKNIGPISPGAVGTTIANADAMVNVALLESFSNNWVEAWAAGIPLIATDAEFCRAACGDAALYIDPKDAISSAKSIAFALSDESSRKSLVAAGARQLNSLPSVKEKFLRYEEIIKSALCSLG